MALQIQAPTALDRHQTREVASRDIDGTTGAGGPLVAQLRGAGNRCLRNAQPGDRQDQGTDAPSPNVHAQPSVQRCRTTAVRHRPRSMLSPRRDPRAQGQVTADVPIRSAANMVYQG